MHPCIVRMNKPRMYDRFDFGLFNCILFFKCDGDDDLEILLLSFAFQSLWHFPVINTILWLQRLFWLIACASSISSSSESSSRRHPAPHDTNDRLKPQMPIRWPGVAAIVPREPWSTAAIICSPGCCVGGDRTMMMGQTRTILLYCMRSSIIMAIVWVWRKWLSFSWRSWCCFSRHGCRVEIFWNLTKECVLQQFNKSKKATVLSDRTHISTCIIGKRYPRTLRGTRPPLSVS